MRRLRRLLSVFVLLAGFGVTVWWLLETDHFPSTGVYPVGSKTPDDQALGGFGLCENYPKNLADQDWGQAGEVSIVALPKQDATDANRQWFVVRVVNRSDDDVGFLACDSCLYLSQEALDRYGNWQPIERAPQSYCGNSYHRVFLGKDQYWELPARRYSGTLKTRLRFSLAQGEWEPHPLFKSAKGEPPILKRAGNGRVIYSNEFDGWVNESLIWLAKRK